MVAGIKEHSLAVNEPYPGRENEKILDLGNSVVTPWLSEDCPGVLLTECSWETYLGSICWIALPVGRKRGQFVWTPSGRARYHPCLLIRGVGSAPSPPPPRPTLRPRPDPHVPTPIPSPPRVQPPRPVTSNPTVLYREMTGKGGARGPPLSLHGVTDAGCTCGPYWLNHTKPCGTLI